MEISINPPTFLWFVPDSSIHLTDENPGPVIVDFATLSKENQKLIILGMRNKQIVTSENELNLVDIYNGSKPSHTVTVQSFTGNDEEQELQETSSSEEEIKKTCSQKLNLTPSNIKKFINSSDNIRLLRIMLELEKETRDRSHIVKCISDKLETLTLQVQSSIATENGTVVALLPDPLADQFSITDSEVEERLVELER